MVKHKTTDLEVLPKELDRKDILAILSSSILEMQFKLSNGRIKNPDNERIKIQQANSVGYLCGIFSRTYKDQQLDKLQDQIEGLKIAIKNPSIEEDKPTEEDVEEVENLLKKLEGGDESD